MNWPPRIHVAVSVRGDSRGHRAIVEAQFGRRFFNTRIATPEDVDGSFHFCRIVFSSDPRGGADGGWNVDWPRADINLSVRLSELTQDHRSAAARRRAEPLADPADGRHALSMSVHHDDRGGSASSEPARKSERLRDYLLKGGFLWADDFWGTYAWDWWDDQMRKVLPPSEYPVITLDGSPPAVPDAVQDQERHAADSRSINFWAGSGGQTSERGADSAVADIARGRRQPRPHHGADDPQHRLGDSFEREADDPRYFTEMSVPGYAYGINALLYAMTH